MTDDSSGQVPFQAHVELLREFLGHRKDVVDRIESVLNAQRRPLQYRQDRPLLSRLMDDCFFARSAITAQQSRLRGRLEEAHWASGFRPSQVPGLHNDVVDPAELTVRAFFCWQQTRWPGRNGRLRFAQSLFNLYLLRALVLLSMRLWDAGSNAAGERLAQVQVTLDRLWSSSPSDLPVLVRDARWLIPLAQSPTTEELSAYFQVAEHVAESLPAGERIEVQKAGVRMIGGHLCSQIRHYCMQDDLSIDEASVIRRTRTSNALDFALLIQSLVSLLEAYDRAAHAGEDQLRLELAGAICQGISADPELFLNRVDLLGPYSMIEHVFITTDRDGQAAYTEMGRRHARLLEEYEAAIGRLAAPLNEDCPQFGPVDGTCSPFGVIFGTPTHLIEDMVLKTLQPDAENRFGLEDVFIDGDPGGDKLAWVNGWRRLPHVDREVQKLYEYPQRFAEEIFDRIERSLRDRMAGGRASEGARIGRLFVPPGEVAERGSAASASPALPVRYLVSSDPAIVAAGKAEACDETRLLRDRREGHFIVSYRTSGGWLAISKNCLTDVLGAGHDAKLAGLPPEAASVVRLMCPGLVESEDVSRQASVPPSMVNA